MNYSRNSEKRFFTYYMVHIYIYMNHIICKVKFFGNIDKMWKVLYPRHRCINFAGGGYNLSFARPGYTLGRKYARRRGAVNESEAKKERFSASFPVHGVEPVLRRGINQRR